MKKLLLLLTELSLFVSLSAQTIPQNGIYQNAERNKCIMIDDSLVTIYRPACHHLYEKEIFAECRIHEIIKPFFKISTITNTEKEAFQDMSSVWSVGEEDFILKIIFPSYHHRLKVTIYTNQNKPVSLDYYSNEAIRLPRKNLLSLSIEITNPLDHIIFPNEMYGCIPCYTSEIFNVDKNAGALSITLPNICEQLFSRIFINGEYIRFDNRHLEWRNEKYYLINAL